MDVTRKAAFAFCALMAPSLFLTNASPVYAQMPVAAAADSAANAASRDADSLAARIAIRYGAEAFSDVKALHFKFNVRMKEMRVAREWTWFPQTDSVEYRGPDGKGLTVTAAYSRKNAFSMGAENVSAIDKSFINDQYWLLFPLHLRWDTQTDLKLAPAGATGGKPGHGKAKGMARGPGKSAEAYRLTVTYPSAGGYTPGDAYDLYVDSTATIRRWMFRKGNSGEGREAFWSEPVEIGGLYFSLEHPGPDKNFKLWFTDVKVDR